MEGVTDKCKTCGGSKTVKVLRCFRCGYEPSNPLDKRGRRHPRSHDEDMGFAIRPCPDCGNAVTKDKEE